MTKQVPLDYPPVEDDADTAIPLYWEPTPDSSGAKPVPRRVHYHAEHPLKDILAHISTDLDKLREEVPGGIGWLHNLWTVRSGDKQLVYYLIELNEVDKDKWKLVDAQVRQILFTQFRSVFLDPPPLRYTVWEDDDEYFGGHMDRGRHQL